MEIRHVENAPPLAGWVLACAAGVTAFGVSLLVIGLGWLGSAFVAAVITLVVGAIFTWGDPPAVTAARVGVPAPTSAVAAVNKVTPAASPASAPPNAATSADLAVAQVTAPVASLPAAAGPAAAQVDLATPSDGAERTVGLSAPIGVADDLKRITGVGPVLESRLNGLGIYHFWQIAKWSSLEVERIDEALIVKGRITRDNWVSQASRLAQASSSGPV